MPKLFLDLDGVLADFDRAVKEWLGLKHTKDMPDKDLWEAVGARKNFFRDLPLTPDAFALWEGVKGLEPTILTGCPNHQHGLGGTA